MVQFRRAFSAIRGFAVWAGRVNVTTRRVLLAAMLAASSIPAAAQVQPLQVLANHLRPEVQNHTAAYVGPMAADEQMHLSVMLPLRNRQALQALLVRLYDPASPDYRHFLTVQQFADQFGPTEQDYDAVASYLQSNGLAVDPVPSNRLVVPLHGAVAQINGAFHVQMTLYQHPTENRNFFSPDRAPSLGLATPVQHIAGLDNFSLPQPMVVRSQSVQTPLGVQGSGPSGGYLASDMRAAYYGGTALTGVGQAVGLVEFGGYNIADVNLTFSSVGQTYSVPVNNVLLDGSTGAINSSYGDAEQVLDIVQAIGMAPGLSQVRVYIGSGADNTNVLNSIATENIVKQIGCSWGWSPVDPTADEPLFQEMAAQGQTFFTASGDDGAYDAAISPFFYPAEDPYVVSVGGTHLITTGAAGAWSAETVWNTTVGTSVGGSGGGISPDGLAIPSYQAGVANSANAGSSTLRNVPDLAMEADYDNYVCTNGACSGGYAGTSFATPRWAGFMALVNQQASENGTATGLGFINPTLYSLAQGSNGSLDFHDIVSGNNRTENQPVWYSAVAGYDLTTGWGSPNGQYLIDDLAGQQGVGFWLEAAQSTVYVNPSNSASTSIQINDFSGFTGAVTLAVTSTLPAGVTASFGTNPATGSSVVTFAAANNVSSQTLNVTITGTSGSITASTSFALTIHPPSFELLSSLSALSVNINGTAASTVSVYPQYGFSGNVALSVSGLPSGVTATFSPATTSTYSTLTLTASASAGAGTTNVTVTGTSGSVSTSITVPLTVIGPSFALETTNIPLALGIGSSAPTYLYVISQSGFSGSVALSASNLPKGVTAAFSTNPVSITASGTVYPTLTFFADATASPGLSNVTITGVSGTLSESATVQLTVAAPAFTLSTNSSVTVGQGATANTYVTINPSYGFTGNVTMSVAGLPAGVTGIWSSNPTTPSLNQATLAISASSTATPGQYPLTFTGVYGSQTVTTTGTLTVVAPSFTLYTNNSLTLGIGSTASDYVDVEGQYGFSGNVTFSVSGLPAGVTGTFSPASSTYSTTLNLTASTSALAGTYTVTVTGVSGSQSAKTTLTLTLGQPSFTLSGSSTTLGQGATANTYVYVNTANGFSGSVNLSVSGLPSGVTAAFSSNPTTYESGLTFTASSSAAPGQYTIAVTGTSGPLTASTNLTLTVAAPSFALTAYVDSTVPVGGSGYGIVYFNSANGFSGNVTMSASGLPAGLTATFSPNPTTYESQITFTAAGTVAPGTYPIAMTGVSGNLTASTTMSVTVASPSFTLSVPTSVTMGLNSTSTNYVYIYDSNSFSGSVTFSVSGLPAGVSASFGSNPTTYSSSLVLTSSSAAAFGTSTITVTGISGSLTSSTTFTLTIAPASFAITTPYNLAVNPGGSSSGTVTLTGQFGFSGNVSFAASGLPAGVTATFTPNPATTSPQLTLAASSSSPPGTYNYTVTGTSGSITASATGSFTINTPNYSISASKAQVSVPIGGAATTSIIVAPTNGFSGSVTLAITGLPTGVTATLNPATDTTTSTLTFTAASTAAAGYSNIVIQGTYAGSISQTTVLLHVLPAQTATTTSVAFSAGGPAVTSVTAGTLVTATISVLAGTTPVTAGSVYLCNAAAPACNGAHQAATAQLASTGSATLKFIPGPGVRRYVAAYAGTLTNGGSLSPASPLTVTASLATATTIAQSGSSGNYTLTATTTAQGDLPPTGTASFLDTTTNNAVLATHSVATSAIGVTQSASQTIATGADPRYSVAADFNGDGYPDLAISITGGTSVSILLNNKGTFTTGTSLQLTSAPTYIATGDFNGDSKADIAVTLASLSSVAIFLGNGDGTFSAPVLYPTSASPAGLVAGDYNRDGNLDLAVVTSNGILNILLGKGDGTFTLSNISPTVLYYSQAIAQADLNGDGIPDLVFGSTSSNDLEVLLGNGDGTFTTLPLITATNYPSQVVVADLNQDGVPDLVTASTYGYSVAVYLGNGDGTFTAAATPPFTGQIYSIAAADINGDGVPDLAGTDYSGSRVLTLTGNGNGTFTSSSIVSTGSNPEFVVAADWNGDGIIDLAVPNLYSNSVTVVTTQLAQTVAATVSGISPDGTGPHKVVAKYSGDAAYASSTSASTTLTATPGAPAVTVTPSSTSITLAQPLTVAVSVSSVPGDPVPTGAVTVSSGSFTSASVTLSSGAATITIPAGSLAGGADTLTASYTPDSASTATYTSATGTASVTVGKLTPTVTVTPAAGSVSTTSTLSVAVTVTGSTGAGTPTGSVTLSSGSFTSTAATLNSGSTNMTVPATNLPIGQDILTVTYTPDSSSSATYTTASGAATVTVTQAMSTLTWAPPAPITYGTALSATQLDATSSVPGTFVYSPSVGAVLAAGNQTLSVTFTPTDTVDYSVTTASVTLTVLKATPAITWTAPAAIAYGTALSATQLNASSSIAGAFTYTPAAGAVLAAGNQTLSVTFTPTDSTDYNTVTASTTITVNKTTTAITWSAPAAITYGTALSATQLNATSTVAGSFSYSPALGTVLPAGTQSLAVTFTPSDTTDYSTATATVALTVNKAALNIAASNASRVYGLANPSFTGTVTGTVNGDTFVETFSTAATIASAAGGYAIVPAVTGANSADYTVTATNGTLSITPAPTSTTFALSNQNLTFTATVATAVTGTPTRSVTFYQGQTSLGSGTLNNGVASITLTSFPTGTTPLSAQYSGDGNFAGSTSASAAVLAIGLSSSSLTVTSGSSVSDTVTIAAPTGYTGTVQLACSGLPQYASCAFQAAALSFTGSSATATSTLTIATNSLASVTPPLLRPRSMRRVECAMLLSLPALLICALGRRRRKLGSLSACCLLLLLGSAGIGLSGCGGGTNNNAGSGGSVGNKSPAGSYSVQVTATSPNGVAQSTISLTVQ
jgi:subtilase family serine protease